MKRKLVCLLIAGTILVISGCDHGKEVSNEAKATDGTTNIQGEIVVDENSEPEVKTLTISAAGDVPLAMPMCKVTRVHLSNNMIFNRIRGFSFGM